MDCLHPGIELIIGATSGNDVSGVASIVSFIIILVASCALAACGLVKCINIIFPSDAKIKSKRLLLSHLDAVQRMQFEAYCMFYVVGGKTGILYLIKCHSGVFGNIEANGRMMCVYVPDVPKYDCFLAQKLMLECPQTEEHVRNIAHYG
jgi:hypothetical protein